MKAKAISVVICTIGRLTSLKKCLTAFQTQSDLHFEIIIIDGSECKEIREIVDEFKTHFQIIYKTIHEHNLPKARNLGISLSKFEIVACIDDDTVPDKDWVLKVKSIFDKHRDAVIIGGGLLGISKDYLSVFSQKYFTWNNIPHAVKTNRVIGSHMLIHLARRNKLRPKRPAVFNDQYWTAGDDTEACLYIDRLNGTIMYDPEISIYHEFRSSLGKFLFRQQQYAFGDYQVSLEFPEVQVSPYISLLIKKKHAWLIVILFAQIFEKTKDLGFYWFPALLLREIGYTKGLYLADKFFKYANK